MNKLPLPTPRQEEWADMELGVIIHHCMETYHPEIPINLWKCSRDKMPAESFAPTDENPDQWMAAAAKMGAKYAVFVANHVTGFSMWPTKENKYSMESSPFKNGQADTVRDFVEACKKHGIRPGIYYSTGCNGYYDISDEVIKDHKSQKYRDYVQVVERQLTELWSNYGELFEIWFDGGVIPRSEGGPNVVELLQKYQPNAVCFQGPREHSQNLRWVGNERGIAPNDCWATTNVRVSGFGGTEESDVIGIGNPDGAAWIPAETDMGNRKQKAMGGGWCWRENEEHLVYSPQELMDRYLTSVGRNSNLLMGMAISKRGHFEDTEQFEEFGRLVRELYARPAAGTKGEGTKFTLTLPKAEFARNLVIMEDIHHGERVREFTVTAGTAAGEEQLISAHCIGHKRIVPVNREITSITLSITACADTPIIRDMTLYY